MARPNAGQQATAIVAVRLLLGIQALLSGLNWWIKILPFPNIHESVSGPVKHEILRVMVDSGWMFTSTKAIELLLGLALIFNRHAVLMLVVSFPIMLTTFLLDLLPFLDNVRPFLAGNLPFAAIWASFLDMLFFGAGVFVMQAFLMSAWFSDYRSLFVGRPGGAPASWAAVFEWRWLNRTLLCLSLTVGALSTIWIVGMAIGIVPWSSLSLLAPPR